METNDDGLFNRFIFAVAFRRTPMENCPAPADVIPKLAHLFYLTRLLHKEQLDYRFSDEGNLR